MEKTFKILCIGGGSIKGIAELGALHYFYNEAIIHYDEIHTFIGTSIGAVISLLMCIGYKPMDILIQILKIETWMDINISDLLYFKDNYGLIDIKTFTKHVETFVKQKLNIVPTFKQLYEFTGKRLIVTAVNVTKHKIEYFDYDNSPDLSCIKAIQMSCSLPLIFKTIEHEECCYIDGAMLDPFPISYINDEETCILGLCIEGFNKFNQGFWNYVYSLFSMSTSEIQKMKIKNLTSNCTIINLKIGDTSSIDFHISRDKKMKLFCDGYKKAEDIWFDMFQ